MSDVTAYGWDDVVTDPQEDSSILLPAGDYPFRVTKMERGNHEPKPGGKLQACKKAKVSIVVDGGPLGELNMIDDFFLVSSLDWKVCDLFESLGLRKKAAQGQPKAPLDIGMFGSIAGYGGTLTIKQETYKDVTRNKVGKYLEPKGAVAAPVAAPVAPVALAQPVVDDGLTF